MSRKPYECFKCRDSGFPNTMVYLAGKDDQGRTIQLEEDGTKHIHKTKAEAGSTENDAQTTSLESKDYGVPEESVQRGITAFGMMSSLIVLAKQDWCPMIRRNIFWMLLGTRLYVRDGWIIVEEERGTNGA